MEVHLAYMETLLGDSADKHGKEMKLHTLRWLICTLLKSCANKEYHLSLQTRIE